MVQTLLHYVKCEPYKKNLWLTMITVKLSNELVVKPIKVTFAQRKM